MRSIDVTGLPEEAVRALEVLVDTWRKEKPAAKPPEEVPLWQRSHEEWSKALHEWIESHPRLDTFVDWSRESIYGDDGR